MTTRNTVGVRVYGPDADGGGTYICVIDDQVWELNLDSVNGRWYWARKLGTFRERTTRTRTLGRTKKWGKPVALLDLPQAARLTLARLIDDVLNGVVTK